jgi:hypothetical protein
MASSFSRNTEVCFHEQQLEQALTHAWHLCRGGDIDWSLERGQNFDNAVGAGLDKMDIRWILEEAATDCHRLDLEPGNPRFDPAFVIDAARKVPSTSVVTSNFMEAYSASLRAAIINGVNVRPFQWCVSTAGLQGHNTTEP